MYDLVDGGMAIDIFLKHFWIKLSCFCCCCCCWTATLALMTTHLPSRAIVAPSLCAGLSTMRLLHFTNSLCVAVGGWVARLHEITTDIGGDYDAQYCQTDEDHDFLLQ